MASAPLLHQGERAALRFAEMMGQLARRGWRKRAEAGESAQRLAKARRGWRKRAEAGEKNTQPHEPAHSTPATLLRPNRKHRTTNRCRSSTASPHPDPAIPRAQPAPRRSAPRFAGKIGPITLGLMRLPLGRLVCGSGLVTAWAALFFTLLRGLGGRQHESLRASQVAARLMCSEYDFWQPQNHYDSFSVIHPASIPG